MKKYQKKQKKLKIKIIDNWGVLEWYINDVDVTGRLSWIKLKMPDKSKQEFDVIWKTKRTTVFDMGHSFSVEYLAAFLVHELHGYENHIDLEKLLDHIKVIDYMDY
jgi:hypothetical protein